MLWAMSDERVAALRKQLADGLDAFNRGDLDAATEGFAEDCRYQIQRDHPEARVCTGREEIRRYQQEWFDQISDIRFDVSEVLVRWPYGLVSGRIHGRGAGSGVELNVDLAILYEVNDEIRAVSAEEFVDLAEAHRALDARTGAAAKD